MISGQIFDIQKFSVHNGPGIRTTIFFKGCPLRCSWCHNPESLSRGPQLLSYKDRCKLCGECIKKCPENALKIDGMLLKINREKCNLCGECENVCMNSALEIVGSDKTVQDILHEIEKDEIFYETSGGGVTFSGGEPFMQEDFLREIIKGCKIRGYHTAIDTSGMTSYKNIESVLEYTDLFLYDLKLIDDEKHKKYVGASNYIILENLRKLSSEGIEIFIRVPLIKGINDSLRDIDNIIMSIKDLDNISQVNLLEYHSMGKEKYNRLDMEYSLVGNEKPSVDRMNSIKQRFETVGFKTIIGG